MSKINYTANVNAGKLLKSFLKNDFLQFHHNSGLVRKYIKHNIVICHKVRQ